MYLQQVVSAHQPHEPVFTPDIREPRQGIGGKTRPQPRLGVRYMNAGVSGGDFLGRLQPLSVIGHALFGFQRVLRRHQPPDLVQRQPLQRLFTYI